MANFIRDTLLAIFDAKSVVALPTGVPRTSRGTGDDWNEVRQALIDTRTEVRGREFNVKHYGAVGDGSTDDTAACAAAHAACAAAGGGDILYPAPGTYLVDGAGADADRDSDAGGLFVGSNTRVVIQPGATVKQKASSSPNYKVFRVGQSATNVTFTGGGTVQGDRASHTYAGGGTHEWGYGLVITGGASSVLVENLTFKDCTGDGITVQDSSAGSGLGTDGNRPRGVTLRNVTCTNNRRNALSLIGVRGFSAEGCTFSYTNGTAPQHGVDIEPGGFGHEVHDARFVGCTYRNNTGRGFHAEGATSATTLDVNGVAVLGGTAKDNTDVGLGAYNFGGGVTFSGVLVTGNGQDGIHVLSVTDASIQGNDVNGNSQTTDNARDGIFVQSSSRVFVSGNRVRKGSGAKRHRYGLQFVAATDSWADGNDLQNSGQTNDYNDFTPTNVRVTQTRRLGGAVEAERFQDATYGATVAVDVAKGRLVRITTSNTSAFAIAAPTNGTAGDTLTIQVREGAGGVMGAITWNSVYKMATWTNPTAFRARSITFLYDGGTSWVEVSRTPADTTF